MNDPRFESLGDEEFQRFCQSLLSYEAPDLQALEIGQPDGGRDAFNRIRGLRRGQTDEYGIYQVKFSKSGKAPSDPVKWVEGVLKAELPKIQLLAERGATSYRLITNVPGSAHLDCGAVDKVNRYLATLPIPADCWWRNDLIVRLAKHPDLRWAYPDLLTPTDILRELVHRPLSEDAERRTNAIQAFLASQYQDEKYVRFKQVELQTDILNVFIDVPAAVRPAGRSEHVDRARQLVALLAPTDHERYRAGRSVGAAQLLVDHRAVLIPHVVVEGAPGQGKSTLAQYLCQVHRMRLLRKSHDLRNVPDLYKSGPIRLPFKIDLRDFAAFLRKDDPFEDDPEWAGILEGQPRTVEGFLAGSVKRHSGGAEFNVADLQAVLTVSHALIVFDGLDEVADLDDRATVVHAIESANSRLDGVALGLQTVVTSRPAAFTQSPGFSTEEVPHLELVSITKELAVDYSERWAATRRLTEKEKRDVRRVLSKQLDQPHIRELARNPMQLTILLNLIRTKGDSLPDKRTDLYASYMDKFFDREAEKAEFVRANRDNLEAFHEYLAWLLHSEAERDGRGGSIGEADLKAEVGNFLDRKGSEQQGAARSAGQLFKGVGRVMALTSRVQGRFEFEVQPIREYFAAAFLYKTAQVSTPGHEKPGDILVRFDGLARNPYWLNVVRFYAGFYNSGQLSSLVYRLKALKDDPVWRDTDRPRMLTTMFLGDWSFAPEKDSRNDAVELALDGLGERHDLSVMGGGRSNDSITLLPLGAGREQLVERVWSLLDGGQLPEDRRVAMESLFGRMHPPSSSAWVERLRAVTGPKRTELLRMGWSVGYLRELSRQDQELIWDDEYEGDFGIRAAFAMSEQLGGEVEADEARTSAFIRDVIDGRVLPIYDPSEPGWLGSLFLLMQPYGGLSGANYDRLIHRVSSSSAPRRKTQSLSPTAQLVADICWEFGESIKNGVPPDHLVPQVLDRCREVWGEGWGLYRAAFGLVGVEGRPPRLGSQVALADHEASLHRRIRFARGKGGRSSGRWWLEQIDAASSPLERKAVAVAALSWPSKDALLAVLEPAGELLKSMEERDFSDACHQIDALGWNRGAGRSPEVPDAVLRSLPQRTALALARRDPHGFGKRLFRARFKSYQGKDPAVMRFTLDYAADAVKRGVSEKSAEIKTLRRLYRALERGPSELPDSGRQEYRSMALGTAKSIMREPSDYPLDVVQMAERTCSVFAGSDAPPLAELASEQRWFAGQL